MSLAEPRSPELVNAVLEVARAVDPDTGFFYQQSFIGLRRVEPNSAEFRWFSDSEPLPAQSPQWGPRQPDPPGDYTSEVFNNASIPVHQCSDRGLRHYTLQILHSLSLNMKQHYFKPISLSPLPTQCAGINSNGRLQNIPCFELSYVQFAVICQYKPEQAGSA